MAQLSERHRNPSLRSRILSGRLPWKRLSPLLDLLLPPNCPCCRVRPPEDREPHPFCRPCLDRLTDRGTPPCPRCARPLPVGARPDASNCPVCRQRRFAFFQTTAIGPYEAALRDAVLLTKRAYHEPLTHALGQLLALTWQQRPDRIPPDLVVPVPMHWSRRWRRTTNGPDILARAMAAHMGGASPGRVVYCRRKTRKQGTLGPSERRRNVRHAFGVSAGYDLRGKKVLLVDDVMTTGATADEIARLLRRRGAANVSIAVIARGVGFR